ncbi:asparaginase [Kroppenstedtia eburnea]|uniref:asparaginase n=1 Tax=Kroppenstedtia eburnea TaxID=714067 RepID=UPI0036439168
MEDVVRVYRGEWLESTHRIHAAVVDPSGKLLWHLGDAFRPTFPRSALKPVQALPVVLSGAAKRFAFEEADLALCCASHNGEEAHRHRVATMLKRAGLSEEDLECGTHSPRDRESYHALIRRGEAPTPIYNNCSGKHAGMAATAVHMGEDPVGYSDADHPVQRRILEEIAFLSDIPAEKIVYGVDGCGVPAYRLPLDRLAAIYARLAGPSREQDPSRRLAMEQVTDAMVHHPEMVGGKNRYCTDLMKAFNGRLVGKQGAEAVYCVGDRKEGLGIAVKVEDGAERVLYEAVNEILRQLGIGRDTGELDLLAAYTRPEVKNAKGDTVGRIQSVFTLRAGEPVRW